MTLRNSQIELDQPVALAAITASELLMGVHRANTPERRLRREIFVERLLITPPVLSFDMAAARIYAQLSVNLRSRGLPIGAHDTLIAAAALAYGYQLLTDNLRHFERIEGLSVRRGDSKRWLGTLALDVKNE